MNQATMPSMLTGDYEQLRAAALTPRSSSAGSSCAQRLVDEGLYAWLMNRGGAQVPGHPGAARVSGQRQQRHDMIQLLASMTLQSLTENADVDLQRQ